jgi:uncharacterized membrane protein
MIVEQADRASDGAGWTPRHAGAAPRTGIEGHVAALVLIGLLVPVHQWWPAQLLLVPFLLVTPGVILLRALRIPGRMVCSFPVYLPCASIVVLIGSGLAVDVAGPLVGVAEPLRTWPLLVSLEITCLALLAASLSAPSDVSIPWPALTRPGRLAWPLILPLLAAAGALRLNSGHGNGVAVIAVCALIILFVVAAFSSWFDEALLQVVLYAGGLAMVWSDSLRGDPLYGFDIATEYQRLQQTISAGVWHLGHPNDAYGAMLSVTVLPAELHFLSGMPGLLVFKVIYPLCYALFPVAIFGLARQVLSGRWAFVAAAFTIGQYAFAEMAGFARQEIALVFFSALIAAMLETRMRRRPQWALIALLGVTTACCHYSTTYVAITVIGIAIPLQWAVSFIRDVPRLSGAMVAAFAAVLLGALVWYIPVTRSDSHVLAVAQTVEAQGLNILPNRTPGSSLISAYLQGNSKTPISASQYQVQIYSHYLNFRSYVHPVPAAKEPQYDLRNSSVPRPAVKWRFGYNALNLGLLLIEQFANLLAALGALLMVLRRKTSLLARQIGLLALATTLLLTVLRFSGTLATAYGQERAQLQGLALLAVSLCWCLEGLDRVRKVRQSLVVALGATSLAVVLVNTSYLTGALLGGLTSVNLANSGPAYEESYLTAPEIASAQWLASLIQPGQIVYTDEYGQIPLAAVTDIQNGLFFDLTPRTINDHAWIYATRTNIANGRAFALYNEHLATYVFPAGFLDANYDLVFTDGTSEVFHR